MIQPKEREDGFVALRCQEVHVGYDCKDSIPDRPPIRDWFQGVTGNARRYRRMKSCCFGLETDDHHTKRTADTRSRPLSTPSRNGFEEVRRPDSQQERLSKRNPMTAALGCETRGSSENRTAFATQRPVPPGSEVSQRDFDGENLKAFGKVQKGLLE